MCVLATQLCPVLCDPADFVYGTLQARILEWVAIQSITEATTVRMLKRSLSGRRQMTSDRKMDLHKGIKSTKSGGASDW